MKDLLNSLINNAIAPSGSSGQGGTKDHNELTNRDAEDQHPISAITGLQNSLDSKASKVNYSTTEQDTGLKWIDGKTIFSKSYSGNIARHASFTWDTIDTIANVSTLIKVEGTIGEADGGGITTIPSYRSSDMGTERKVIVVFNRNTGVFELGTLWFMGTDQKEYNITIYYTKTT